MKRLVARQFASTLWDVVKNVLMLTGVVALVAWEVDKFSHRGSSAMAATRQAGAEGLPSAPLLDAMRPASLAVETKALADEADLPLAGDSTEHKRVSTFLARKYKVAADATHWIVNAAFLAGKDVGVDPLLILAVMAIESRMNPFAESGMGAQGLMQVIPKYHLDKLQELGGRDAILNPVVNIRVGALILKDYLQRFGGLEQGLRAYSGATGDDYGYASKVLAERDRLKAAAGGSTSVSVAAPSVPLATAIPVVHPESQPAQQQVKADPAAAEEV